MCGMHLPNHSFKHASVFDNLDNSFPILIQELEPGADPGGQPGGGVIKGNVSCSKQKC